LKPHYTAEIFGGQNHGRKTPFPFPEEISPSAKSEMQGEF